MESTIEEETQSQGALLDSLKRNNKRIKEERAIAISEDAGIVYRRRAEDMAIKLKRLIRKREDALDMSPATADSLKPAQDVDIDVFVENDLKWSLEIRNLEIELEVAVARYKHMFGEEIKV